MYKIYILKTGKLSEKSLSSVLVVAVAEGVAGAEGLAVVGGDDVAAIVDDADHAAGAEAAVEVGARIWKKEERAKRYL